MIKSALYLTLAGSLALISCTEKRDSQEKTHFTKTDSLTESYLLLQDSLLHSWNVMARDENQKLEAMHNLLHLMLNHEGFDKQQILTLEQRLEQLNRIRFTQKSLANNHVIDEYDFESNSLVTEITSLAESNSSFKELDASYNLVKKVLQSDQQVIYYRTRYDMVASRYNQFLEINSRWLDEIDKDHSSEKRPLFHVVSE